MIPPLWHALRRTGAGPLTRHLVRRTKQALWQALPAGTIAHTPPQPPRAGWSLPAALRDLRTGEVAQREGRWLFALPGLWVPFSALKRWEIGTTTISKHALHWFGWLPEGLRAGALGPAEALGLLRDWVRAHPPGSQPAWAAYGTSLRIANWLVTRALLERSPWPAELDASLSEQAGFLARNVELDLPGNHLVTNARALIYAGAYFDGPTAARWLEQGLSLLARCLREQLLPDGGHFERSPMYHLHVLRDLTECALLANHLGFTLPPECDEALSRMASWARAMQSCSGDWPRFGDSYLDPGLDAEQALRLAQEHLGQATGRGVSGRAALHDSGFYILGGRDDFLRLVVTFAAEAPGIPGHTHGDVGSFELSINGRDVLVDAGVWTYEPSPERQALRSSRAHNTVVFDSADQIETWGAFRTGRVAHGRVTEWSEAPGELRLTGRCEGYPGRPDLWHQRSISLYPERLAVLTDTGPAGAGMASLLHFAPGLEIIEHGPSQLLLRGEGFVARLAAGPGNKLSLGAGTCAARLGAPQPCVVATIRSELDDGLIRTAILAAAADQALPDMAWSPDGSLLAGEGPPLHPGPS